MHMFRCLTSLLVLMYLIFFRALVFVGSGFIKLIKIHLVSEVCFTAVFPIESPQLIVLTVLVLYLNIQDLNVFLV